ncbi:MAG: type I DNA topoisomerase [Bacteroidales bacterium]
MAKQSKEEKKEKKSSTSKKTTNKSSTYTLKGKNLVIVESPAKAKTIEKYLGSDFTVLSSFGHIRDLPKGELGVDVEKNFEPKYVIIKGKEKVINQLSAASNQSELVWLATDEDREGEAISWHLAEALEIPEDKLKRITFHEITKSAIEEAIKNPRGIDYNLVNAQQARRILDRLVGYELSPVLWRKIAKNLSAGRVQSVGLRLIVERDREIERFVAEESYKISGNFFLLEKPDILLSAELNHEFKKEKDALNFLEKSKNAIFTIKDIKQHPAKRTPPPPFITSTLQQEAAKQLRFSVSQTMNIAQQLYEAGLITYMRTDSVTLSNLALNAAKEFITKNYGEKYYKRRQYKNKVKGAQEAHEAIRPTDLSKSTIEATQQMKRFYELIWRRTIASQMSDAEFIRATISIASDQNKHLFLAKSESLVFDGYLKIYQEKDDDDDVKEITSAIDISKFKIDDRLDFKDITAKQSFTNPPYHYNEAALVKKLEELGIGRPSTYATIITTIQQRDYVDKRSIPAKERNIKIYTLDNSKKIKDTEKKEKYGGEKQKLISTELGKVVTDFLMKHFPDIMDYNFTAEIEERFDKIALGQEEWQDMLRDFYKDFHPKVLEAIETSSKQHISRLLGVDPKTNKNVYITYTKHGMALQLGDYTDNEKPSYVSINKRQNIDFNKITLEEALKFFELPKELGDYQGSKVVVNIGRYGPYVLYKDKFYSIKKLDKPLTEFTLDEAIEIIKQPTGLIKTISEKPLIQLLIGRYGPYIKTDDGNIPIPKGTDINTITDDEIKFIIENHKTKKNKK